LLARVQAEPAPTDADRAAIDRFLADAGDVPLPGALVADLLVAQAISLANEDRTAEALRSLDELLARFADNAELDVAQTVGFAWLTKTRLLAESERVEEAVAAAEQLLAAFEEQPDTQNLTGFGYMLLDVSLWLLAREQADEVLRICSELSDRLTDMNESRRAVAAGARFFTAQALMREGRATAASDMTEALVEMGEPALAALDRIATQFGAEDSNPKWHAQIQTVRASVLSNLNRLADARAVVEQLTAMGERYAFPPVMRAAFVELQQEIDKRAEST
jgi:tetratricopeptide (TPR) repeat protein